MTETVESIDELFEPTDEPMEEFIELKVKKTTAHMVYNRDEHKMDFAKSGRALYLQKSAKFKRDGYVKPQFMVDVQMHWLESWWIVHKLFRRLKNPLWCWRWKHIKKKLDEHLSNDIFPQKVKLF